jgi:hypothetical protein
MGVRMVAQSEQRNNYWCSTEEINVRILIFDFSNVEHRVRSPGVGFPRWNARDLSWVIL